MKEKLKIMLASSMCISFALSGIPHVNAKSTVAFDQVVAIKELTELRDEYTKHFLNDDGTITAVLYANAVHYQDKNGNWKDIDTTFRKIDNGHNGYLVTNDNPYLDAKFNSISNEGNLLNINLAENHKFIMGIDNIKETTAIIKNNNKSVNEMNLSDGTLTYQGIQNDTDLTFNVNSNSIFTEVRFDKKPMNNILSFNIQTDLIAFKDSHGLISFFENGNKDAEIILQLPHMQDSSNTNNGTDNILVDLEKTTDGYKVNYELDNEYLDNSNLIYPLYTTTTVISKPKMVRQNILDTYVHPGDQPGDHYNQDRLYIDNRDGGSRALINWKNYPKIDLGARIIDTHFQFYYWPGTSTYAPIDVDIITQDWDSSTIDYSKSLNLRTESVVRSYDILTSNGYKCGFIDVTKWAYEWYSLDWSLPMGGFMIKYSNESYNDYNAIISGDSGKDSNLWPTLILRYEI